MTSLADEVLLDDTHAVMAPSTFEALQEYSCSLPTGTTPGKRWKRRVPYRDLSVPKRWYMGEYFDDGTPGMMAIRWREILLVPR